MDMNRFNLNETFSRPSSIINIMTYTCLIHNCIFIALIRRQQKMFKNPKMTIALCRNFFSIGYSAFNF